ncbi:MAG: thymidine kinase [Candidatus Eisenbacteria bacterium]|nr:thymidine kinase [Candidatus Eisenbacteria bacterium]
MFRPPSGYGWVEVICGSMFSGKSEELIRRLKRAVIARQKVQAFKPATDTRFSSDHIVSHDRNRVPSALVARPADILSLVEPDTQVVGIDEAQFFDLSLVEVCEELANRGARVIVAGLDQDYLGRPFEPIPQLLAVAESITKTMAVCVCCGAPANRSQRLVSSRERVLVGADTAYEPRCRKCFRPWVTPPEEERCETDT